MRKSGWTSYLFVVIGVFLISIATYMVISYSGRVLDGAIEFLSTNDSTKLQSCGINVPTQLMSLRNDLVGFILPFTYVGLPLYLVVLSVVMFIAGFYYHKAKYEDELGNKEESERAAIREAAARLSKNTK